MTNKRHSELVQRKKQGVYDLYMESQSKYDRYVLPETIEDPMEKELASKNMKENAILRKINQSVKNAEKQAK